MKIATFSKIIFRGIGQIMLQNNAITGLLFLIGIFYNSLEMGLGAVIGVLVSTFTAIILNYKKKDISDGLYGFNGTLVGIAVLFFYDLTIISLCIILIGSILSTLIMNFMHTRNLNPYPFPFVISMWIVILFIKYFNLVQPIIQESLNAPTINTVSALSMGFGQIMFQGNIITGLIFFIAVLINSRIAALFGFLGTSIGMLVAFSLSLPLNLINIGIFGYNAVLCGIAFSDKKISSIFYAILSIILSVFILNGMMSLNIIALVAPFVFSTWIVLLVRNLVKMNTRH